MPRKAKVMALSLTGETRSPLSVLVWSRTAPAHRVDTWPDRRSASETAAALGINRQRITRCVRRVAAVGPLGAINDLPRSGRPPDITEAARSWLIGEVRQAQGPRLPARAVDVASVGRPYTLPRSNSGSYRPGRAGTQHGPRHSEHLFGAPRPGVR